MAIAFIAAAAILTSLKAKGLIDGGNSSEDNSRDLSPKAKIYDDGNDGDSGLFIGWSNGDMDTDMYGNPLHPKRYKRAKRREAKFLGKIYVDD